ncbi:CPBP family intramembrane metalloprotease [Leuconostoc mesenteroides]|nr:CPBP family intramembrane glutamic endopeptidase [Leuconostoc mesenteroides]UUE18775.1 CPBP family intramembrane metalloprotease [Leuconostoc mesenteroides]
MGEEILVRGYLLGKLSQHLSHASAIIISSLFSLRYIWQTQE